MRTEILSERERDTMRAFLKDGTKLRNFYMVSSRARRYWEQIRLDYELLRQFVEALEGEREVKGA